MPDKFTKTSHRSYGGRVVDSFKHLIAGIIFFIASFFVLYYGEGLVDVSKIADNAVKISAESVDPTYDEQLVYTRGPLTAEDEIGDGLYVQKGDYVRLIRTVETYAWKEKTDTDTTRNSDGSETTETTYSYHKAWVYDVPDSSTFEISEGHENIEPTIKGSVTTAQDVKIGAFSLQGNGLTIRNPRLFILSEDILDIKDDTEFVNETYLFNGLGYITDPEIGDMRISYTYVPDGVDHTVFAKQSDEMLVPYIGKKETRLYDAFPQTRDEALAIMHKEFTIKTWIFRGIGFLCMWAGLSMMLGPIAVIADRFKFTGAIARGGIQLITFVIALVLSLATILLSTILHNVWLMIAVAVAILGVVIYKAKQK